MPDRTIPVALPLLGDDEVRAAERAIRSGWVSQGPEVAAFEREFAAYVGAPHAIAVSSCTAALHLALLACGVRPGDHVITASHSFIATANAVRYCGATPVFVDVEPGTFNMDPRLIERVITRRTRAILCVHQMGMPCDLAAMLRIAGAHKLRVIEDAACAIGSEIRWKGKWEQVGKPRGDAACFSFHPRKLVTTGDGGMITVNDAAMDEQLRRMRVHGMSVSAAARHDSAQVIYESYPELGFNYRLTDIQAAVGREQLKRLPAMVAQRRRMVERYRELLSGIAGLGLPEEPSWARSNWQTFCVRLPARADQRRVMQAMLDAGVSTRRGVMCAHREGAYPKGSWWCGDPRCKHAGSCPRLRHSEEAQNHCIMLPLYAQMTEGDQDRVVAALRDALASRRAKRARA